MTMAVGFLCSDGVVIGADRQITQEQKFTFQERKLTRTRWKNGHGILGYAGNHDTYRAFEKVFLSTFSSKAVISRSEVSPLLQKCLAVSVNKKEGFHTLFGSWVDGEWQSLVTSVGTQRVLDVGKCEVIGCADSPLTRFLLGSFKDVPHLFTVHQASMYAVYFISQAKKYDGEYVGGGIDVFSIDKSGDGGERCVRILDAGRTPEWEEQTNSMRYWMDVLFSKLTDKDHPVAMEQFIERMNQFRAWVAPEEQK